MAHTTVGASPFPKWQIAVALGCTGAIGFGYWYMKHYSTDKTKKHNKPSLLALGKKISGSVDDTSEAATTPPSSTTGEKTALQLALEYKTDGNNYFKKGTYDKAIECYTKAIDACPFENPTELSTFYQNRAACYEHLKKHSAVIEDCTRALEFKVNYTKALYRRARAYESTKNWSNCLDDISAVCLLQGFEDQSALLMADRVLKELGRKHAAEAIAKREPLTPSKHFIKTYFLSFSEDPAYNLIMAQVLNKTEPEEGRGFVRARKLFLEGRYDDVIGACTEEIDSMESDGVYKLEAILLRATFHLLRGSHQLALQDFEMIVNNEQADVKVRVSALIKRASLFMQMERPEECIRDFDEAARLGPNISDVFHHRGQVHLLLDKMEEATADFSLAVKLNENYPIAYVQKNYSDYRMALMTRDIQKVTECMDNFQKAIDKFPNCSECYILYAQVLTDQQQCERALEFFDKALKLDSSNATVYVHKAVLHLQWTGDTEIAVKLINEAIQIDPLCEFAFETLATLEVQRSNLESAIELFEKALKLAKTELEMTHLFSLRDMAISQLKISKKLGITLPTM